MRPSTAVTRCLTTGLLVLASLTVLACGSSSKKTTAGAGMGSATAPPTIALSIAEQGKAAKYTVPATAVGGLVTLQLTNQGKATHAAQLVRYAAGHTPIQALKVLGGQGKKTPSWIYAEGGLGEVGPGQTAKGTLVLPPGNYLVVDVGAAQSNGPPAFSQFTVTPGKSGALPSTSTTVTAANPSKDHYKWQIAGSPLAVGPNAITFRSKGSEALHELSVARITGSPSKTQIIKALSSNGAPPAFLDQGSFASSAVIDGGKSQTLSLTVLKPGKYILFCYFKDRTGGKPHFQEGLLTTVTVK